MKKKTIWDLHRDSMQEYKEKEKLPIVVVLDNVRSLSNVGAVLRTSDAFMVEGVMLCGVTGCPPSPEIHKTALGAEESVEWRHYEKTTDCISDLKNAGYTICVLEQVEESVSLEQFSVNPDWRYAVVLGNEVKGVGQDVVDMSDYCLEIPQFGTKHSLNVSVSGGIAIWHFFTAMIKNHKS